MKRWRGVATRQQSRLENNAKFAGMRMHACCCWRQNLFLCGFLQALSGRRERIRRVVMGGTNARPPPPVAQATAQGANTSRAAAWRVRAALTPTAGIWQEEAQEQCKTGSR